VHEFVGPGQDRQGRTLIGSSSSLSCMGDMLGPLDKPSDYVECGPIWIEAQIWCCICDFLCLQAQGDGLRICTPL
jgi:hypothetical protein